MRAIHLRALQTSARIESGHFQQKITNEKNAAAEAEDVVREAQFAGHLQAGEAYVDAVEIRDEVEQEHERHQAAIDVPARALGDVGAHIHELIHERRSVAWSLLH